MLEAAQLHSDTAARILEAVMRAGSGTTRAELAVTLGLTPPSIVRALERLLEGHFLVDEPVTPPGGRPRGVLRVVPDAARLAGVTVEREDDSAGCVVRAGAVDLAGELIGELVEIHVPSAHWGEVTDSVAAAISDLDHSGGPLDAAGISIGGHVDSRRGVVHNSPNLGWVGRPVRLGRDVQELCGLPVTVENDANALALHDRLYGLGRDQPWFASLLVGRGVGVGLFAGTAVVVGRSGRAGEIGHLWVDDDGDCDCGRTGCLEAQIGSRHLLDRLRSQGVARPREIADLGTVTSAADTNPDGAIGSELRRCGTLLGRAIAAMCNLTDVGLVLVRHTGLFDSTVFADAVRDELAARSFPSPGPAELAEPVRLHPADGIRGAAAAALFGLLHERGLAGLRDRQTDALAVGSRA